MSEKLSIKVKILERLYPLLIEWNEEEKIRNAANKINEIVLRFKQHYTDKDNQDLLAMACLQFASKMIDFEAGQKDNTFEMQLDKLIEDIDEFIKIQQ